ncbi:uncharacterized protein BP5553_01634 [Venustampulla echinocandica]|uniref:Uncharacterized protein n=1 Tax=Venustampulla echinocandica TaxID=2656787 RepID=A0A370U1L6_9HELO|nr:uncharacterized protein BP5553_01634 [Venustampulla echinocandica]RDL41655.1 hypothetical protein BP5553_01634 [Venustampulla echinocandica]
MSVVLHERFTATGGPKPSYKAPSVWEKSCPWGMQAPLLPRVRFTDETIIPVIVRLEEGEPESDIDMEKEKAQRQRRSSKVLSKLRHRLQDFGVTLGTSKPHVKCVFMPRREYLKYFAHDTQGNYSGSELQRTWSEDELDAKFKKYQYEKAARWGVCREETRELTEENRESDMGGLYLSKACERTWLSMENCQQDALCESHNSFSRGLKVPVKVLPTTGIDVLVYGVDPGVHSNSVHANGVFLTLLTRDGSHDEVHSNKVSDEKLANRVYWLAQVDEIFMADRHDEFTHVYMGLMNAVSNGGVPFKRPFMIAMPELGSSFASTAYMFWSRTSCDTRLQDLVNTRKAFRPSSIYQDCKSKAWHAAITASASPTDRKGALKASLRPLLALSL